MCTPERKDRSKVVAVTIGHGHREFLRAALSQSVPMPGLPVRNSEVMEPFRVVLYIHVIATLGVVAAMGAEGLVIGQLRRAKERRDATPLAASTPLMTALASICLLVLFLSGGYLTDRAGLWSAAWPKIAVAIIVAFGALAGLSSRRLRKIRRAYANGELPDVEILRELQAPFLTISLGMRSGLVLAAVWLMTAKPSFVDSLGVVVALVSISSGVAAFFRPRVQAHSPAIREASEADRGEDISGEHA